MLSRSCRRTGILSEVIKSETQDEKENTNGKRKLGREEKDYTVSSHFALLLYRRVWRGTLCRFQSVLVAVIFVSKCRNATTATSASARHKYDRFGIWRCYINVLVVAANGTCSYLLRSPFERCCA